MTTSPGDTAAHLARLVVGRSARRLAPRISTTSKDANLLLHPYQKNMRQKRALGARTRHVMRHNEIKSVA
jgi:hypothetical protein